MIPRTIRFFAFATGSVGSPPVLNAGLLVVLDDVELAEVVSQADIMAAFQVAQAGDSIWPDRLEEVRNRPRFGAITDSVD